MAQGKQQKYASIGYVVVAFIGYMVMTNLADLIIDIARWSYPTDWPLTAPELVGLLSALGIFFGLRKHAELNSFVVEAMGELMKVTWPPRKETVMSSVMISVFVSVCALMLVGFDVVWGWAVKVLY